MSFELFVARRYLKTKRKGLFTLVTTSIGVAGVTVGVAALLTTLSVMNGFQTDIRKKIVGAQAHVVVLGRMDGGRLEKTRAALLERKEVAAVAPFVLGQAIITYADRSMGIVLKGLDPAQEFKVNDLARTLTAGSWAGVAGGTTSIVLGEELARNLGAWVGDDVVLVSPQGLSTPLGLMPALRRFRVAGTLKTGYYEYDSATAYVSLEAASAFLKVPGGASGFGARLTDLTLADKTAAALQARLGFEVAVRSFSQMNRTLFAALKLEKAVMFIILTLIILVASLNIASNLILMGTEKLRDVGLLMAMGATPRQIRRIFLWVGFIIGGVGVGAGLLLGLGLCWIIHRYPPVELPADIYYLSRVPVDVTAGDVASIALCALALTLLASLYPAWRAAKTDPVEAIHYG
ncbi:MAG TPA: lipoprotein-releasing system transmembrane subunit LolC [Elusimicrobia bacterium]|nr:lipoprotein-releasing system transmembrane subunit LolC [Elusimicrobiota bacterium]